MKAAFFVIITQNKKTKNKNAPPQLNVYFSLSLHGNRATGWLRFPHLCLKALLIKWCIGFHSNQLPQKPASKPLTASQRVTHGHNLQELEAWLVAENLADRPTVCPVTFHLCPAPINKLSVGSLPNGYQREKGFGNIPSAVATITI